MTGNPPEALRARLEAGNAERAQRKALRELLRARAVDPARLLLGNDHEWEPVAKRMRIDKLLMSLPNIGEPTCQDVLLEAGVAGRTKVGAVGFATRRHLAELVGLVTDAANTRVGEPDESWRETRPEATR